MTKTDSICQWLSERLCFLASPLAGDTQSNIALAQTLSAELCAKNVMPIAPHLLCTQFLDDTKPSERQLGLKIAMRLLPHCQVLLVYTPLGIAKGMQSELTAAMTLRLPIFEISSHSPLTLSEGTELCVSFAKQQTSRLLSSVGGTAMKSDALAESPPTLQAQNEPIQALPSQSCQTEPSQATYIRGRKTNRPPAPSDAVPPEPTQ